jgi:hypothetical protein
MRAFASGGLLPSKSLGAILDVLLAIEARVGRTAWRVFGTQSDSIGAHYPAAKVDYQSAQRALS